MLAAALLAAAWLNEPSGRAVLVGAVYLDQEGVVRQQNSFDCGVAVMEMLASDRSGGGAHFDSMRTIVRLRGRGLSFQEMRETARSLGVEAVGMEMTPAQLRRARSPVVLQFRGHFVVLMGYLDDSTVVLGDPGIGRVAMGVSTMERRWTGMALIVGSPPRD